MFFTLFRPLLIHTGILTKMESGCLKHREKGSSTFREPVLAAHTVLYSEKILSCNARCNVTSIIFAATVICFSPSFSSSFSFLSLFPLSFSSCLALSLLVLFSFSFSSHRDGLNLTSHSTNEERPCTMIH